MSRHKRHKKKKFKKEQLKQERRRGEASDTAPALPSSQGLKSPEKAYQRPGEFYRPFGGDFGLNVSGQLPGGRKVDIKVLYGPPHALDSSVVLRCLHGAPISVEEQRKLTKQYAEAWRCSMTFMTMTITEVTGKSSTFEGEASCSVTDHASLEGGLEAALRRTMQDAADRMPKEFVSLNRRERKAIWAYSMPLLARFILPTSISKERPKKESQAQAVEAAHAHPKVKTMTQAINEALPKLKHKHRHRPNLATRPRRIILAM
jgi:hypothetical protein